MLRLALSQVKSASPCGVHWDAMTGDGRARFCHGCKQRVYNVANLDLDEAEEYLGENVGIATVCWHRRTDGTLLTRDCPVGARAARMDRLRILAFAVITASFLLLWAAASNVSIGARRIRDVEPLRTFMAWVLPEKVVFGTAPQRGCYMILSGEKFIGPPAPDPVVDVVPAAEVE